MRAAVLHSHGAVPEVGDFRDPEPEDGAELLELRAAALNPIDIRVAGGQFPLERYETPYVAGKEGVGARADGSLVYFEYTRKPFGAYGERTLIEAGSGYDVPDGLEPELAVCLGVSGLAAWLGLEWRGRLAPGETVLVLGASGVVGQIAIQAAKLMGAARVVAAARDAEALERARDLGADALVSLHDDVDDLTGTLREAAGGDGFDLVLDPLWGDPARAAIAATKSFGRDRQPRAVGGGGGDADLAGDPLEAGRRARLHELHGGRGAQGGGLRRDGGPRRARRDHGADRADRPRRRARGVAAPGLVAAREARRGAVGTNVNGRIAGSAGGARPAPSGVQELGCDPRRRDAASRSGPERTRRASRPPLNAAVRSSRRRQRSAGAPGPGTT